MVRPRVVSLINRAGLVAGIAVSAAATAALVYGSIFAYRAVFQPSIKLTIGSELAPLSASLALNGDIEQTIQAPAIKKVVVRTPTFAPVVLSAVEKISAEPVIEETAQADAVDADAGIQEKIATILTKRFRQIVGEENGDYPKVDSSQLLPPGITVAEEEIEFEEATEDDQGELIRIVKEDQETPSRLSATSKAPADREPPVVVEPVSIQPEIPLSTGPLMALGSSAKVTDQADYSAPKKAAVDLVKEATVEKALETKPIADNSQRVAAKPRRIKPRKTAKAEAAPRVVTLAPIDSGKMDTQPEVEPLQVLADAAAPKEESVDTQAPMSNQTTDQSIPTIDAASAQIALDTQEQVQMSAAGPSKEEATHEPAGQMSVTILNRSAAVEQTIPLMVEAPKKADAPANIVRPATEPSKDEKKVEGQKTLADHESETGEDASLVSQKRDGEIDFDGLQKALMGLKTASQSPAVNPVDQEARPPVADFSGRIVEAFTKGERPVEAAAVQILGTNVVARTDHAGNFVFKDISVYGILPVIVGKPGYLNRRVDLKPRHPVAVELVNENAVGLTAIAAGESNSVGSSFVFGQLDATNGEGLQAMKIEVSGPAPVLPTYLDEKGLPDRKLAMTSARGQFVLLNLRPGTYLLAITDAFGRERAPHILHVGPAEGVVRKFSMGESRIIRGKVFNAEMNKPVAEAQVQLLGSEKTATTKKDGSFALGPVYVDCEALNYLQIERTGFYRNRSDYACSPNPAVYTFSATYVDGLALGLETVLAPATGVIVGHVSFGSSVKMQLWGPEELHPESAPRGRDFYFNSSGLLEPALNRTEEKGSGDFLILDAPEGLSYIQAFNKENRTLSFWPILISPSTVNVYAQ